MLKIKIAAVSALAAACAFMCACTIDASSSLKELTDSYIARYECTYICYGGRDMTDNFDYVRITFEDKDTLLAEYKTKNGKPHAHRCPYTFDKKTGEFYADFGAAGVKYRQPTKIEDGKFTISFPVAGKQLILRFES